MWKHGGGEHLHFPNKLPASCTHFYTVYRNFSNQHLVYSVAKNGTKPQHPWDLVTLTYPPKKVGSDFSVVIYSFGTPESVVIVSLRWRGSLSRWRLITAGGRRMEG